MHYICVLSVNFLSSATIFGTVTLRPLHHGTYILLWLLFCPLFTHTTEGGHKPHQTASRGHLMLYSKYSSLVGSNLKESGSGDLVAGRSVDN